MFKNLDHNQQNLFLWEAYSVPFLTEDLQVTKSTNNPRDDKTPTPTKTPLYASI